MRFDATPKTAGLTGIWSIIGVTAFDVWEKYYSLDVVTHNVVLLVALIIFFFAPVLVFVIGRQYFHVRLREGPTTHDNWAELKRVGGRMLCWFLAAGFIGLPLQALFKWIIAI